MLLARSYILLSIALAGFATVARGQNDPAADAAKKPRAAITSLFRIDSSVHDAMQDRDYEKAVTLIDGLLAKKQTKSSDYLMYLKGIALTEAKKYAPAIETFQSLAKSFPESKWKTRATFGHAHVLVLQRQYIEAGAIYKKEAERLLSRGRKDELAQVYLEFADKYFEGVPSKDPSQKPKPDYTQAHTYYTAASELGPSTKLLQKIQFRIARCNELLNKHDEALKTYQDFLVDHGLEDPKSGLKASTKVLAEVRFNLGAVQLRAGRVAAARRTWRDFIRTWSAEDADPPAEVRKLLAKAEYRIPHTYGMPTPNTIGQLELGIAAAEGFLKKYPTHELASKTELEVAQAFMRHGRNGDAASRLQGMIANKNYAKSDQIQAARRLLGQTFWTQKKYDEAIKAWKQFLELHPTEPQWPAVQKRILDAEYDKAENARAEKKYAAARELWQTFLNKYPLDTRAPGILYRFGEMKYSEATEKHQKRVEAALQKGNTAQSVLINKACKTLFQESIDDWRRVVAKYPSHADASRATFVIGMTLEDKLGELKDALEAYKQVGGQYQARAKARIKRLTTPQLRIATERKFRSDEKPVIKLTTRNLEKVVVKAYRIDMTDYFRKMHLASGVEKLDIALIDPDHQFEHAVKDYQQYQRIEGDVEIPVDGPGVTAVTIASEELESTTMVIVSDIDIIAKTSRNELFLFAENMRTGKPAAGASVLVSDGSEVFGEALTGDDGILQTSFDELKSIKDLRVFAVHDGHIASTINNLNGLKFATGLGPKGYLFTDRPVYRAGQLVNLKGIVRWVQDDQFTFQAGTKFKLDVYDARGRQIQTEQVALNGFGTVNTNVILPQDAAQGDYRVHLHRADAGPDDKIGALSFETRFKVAQFKLEPVEGTFDIEKQVYFRGEEITGSMTLAYYYGTPLADEEVQYQLIPGGEMRTARTDKEGKVAFKFETQQFSEAMPLKIQFRYPSRDLTFDQSVFLATRGFGVGVSTIRSVFISGETFETNFSVKDPAGEPVEVPLKLEVFERVANRGRLGEVLVQTHEVSTDKDGAAKKTISIEKSGNYIVRATGVDQFGNDVSGQSFLQISGDSDSVRLRILADKYQFDVGQQAKIKVHWREKPALALVTFEGAQVLGYRLVNLKTGQNTLDIPMESSLAPNFFLSIAVMQRNQFHQASRQFIVTQKLNIALSPAGKELKPGDDLELGIKVTDSQGKPVQAELALSMVQANLLEKFVDTQGPLGPFFAAGKRMSSVRQVSSCTFEYQPATRNVSEFLIAESARRFTAEREAAARESLSLGRNAAPAADPFGGGREMNEDLFEDLDDEQTPFVTSVTPQIGGSYSYRTETRTRTVPVTRYRTEIREGREVSVPYTEQVAQSYTVQVPQANGPDQNYTVQVPVQGQVSQGYQMSVPYTVNVPQMEGLQSQMRSAYQMQGQAGQLLAGQDRPYGGQALLKKHMIRNATANSQFLSNNLQLDSVTGLMADGSFVVINGRNEKELQTLVANEGVQIFPALAESETAFWNPTVVTDDSGNATLTISMPKRSTAWQLRAKGIDTKTLAGEASVKLLTKKDLFGDLKLPLAFTAGDQANIPVEIHHSANAARSIEVKLKVTQGSKSVEQTRLIDVQGPGISKVKFPVQIDQAESVEFSLMVAVGDSKDTVSNTVSVRPFGFPVYASASGTSAQSTVAMVSLDEKLKTEDSALEILIGPNVDRALLESVVGQVGSPVLRCGLPSISPIERSISDLIGGVALLEMVGESQDANTPQGQALTGRIASAISHLISAQRDDGGWNWSGRFEAGTVDQLLSARAMWALSVARKAGFVVSQDRFQQGKNFLKSAFSAASQTDLERQTILLQAMAAAGCGDFAYANRLYRERNRLSLSGLSHLALALSEMNHPEMATEILELISITDDKPVYLQSRTQVLPWIRSDIELRALYLLALQKTNSQHADVARMAKWLIRARVGSRWPIEKANGPTIAALASWYASTNHKSEKYKLTISVNGNEIESLQIDPATDPSRTVKIDSDLLNDAKPQKIEFKLDGRATFSYSALMTAFVPADKVVSTTKQWSVSRRYEPAKRSFDGHAVPRGFGVVNGGYRSFYNPLTQLPVGDLGEVTLMPRRSNTSRDLAGQYDYLVLTEPIPAGCSVLDGSVKGQFERFEIEAGQITFYIGDRRSPGDIRYTLIGYVPGEYSAPQSLLRSFYNPSLFAISKIKNLTVIGEEEKSIDAYRLTPDELYHLGQKYFQKGSYDQAFEHLAGLVDNWQLDLDKYKSAVESLFHCSLKRKSHPDIVAYFEIIKQRFADVELSFENILQVAQSYREIGEYERSYLVYRATVEGSFERESQVAGFLNAKGQFIRSVQAMERLLADYPAESYIATATYALAQEVFRRAPKASEDKVLVRNEITRVDLVNASIQMLDHFVTTWPEDPSNDQASFALATALIELDMYKQAIDRCDKYAARYPVSRLLDSFWYMNGYCHFELQEHEKALTLCRKVADATFPIQETGGVRVADNKWEAVYIMGQIYHSLGKATDAIKQYTRVEERFADAAEAINFFSRKDISIDEVTTIQPNEKKVLQLHYRNVASADVKVYRIDLMKFGLMQRNLDRITAINLAGIKPYHQATVKLGDGNDFADKEHELPLPLKEEGAYLVVCRGGNMYASGLVLVSPLELLVQEDRTSGRVRVSVKDKSADKFVGDVNVKVIGANNDEFQSGKTDLRGLFVADNVQGTCTVIAVIDSNRYAFYRGENSLQLPDGAQMDDPFGSPASQEAQPSAQVEESQAPSKAVLRGNFNSLNGGFQEIQKGNYEGLMNNRRKGLKTKEAY